MAAEEMMQRWKKAVVVGSLAAGAAAVATRRRPLGFALIAGGLALAASEYPEKFEAIWEDAPEYMNRLLRIFDVLQKVSQRAAEEAGRRGMAVYSESEEEPGI